MSVGGDWRQAAFENDGPILAQWARENEFEGRAYKDPETGLQYASVTTVLKNTPKKDMMRWAARVVAERARDRPDIVMGDPDKVVDRLQYAPSDYRDERAWVGSCVHQYFEAEAKGLWYQEPEEWTPEQDRMIQSWEEMQVQYEIEPILTEVTVLIPCGTYSVMGTLDGLWRFTDRWSGESFVALFDLKTSKGLWPEHGYQLAALSKASHWFEQVEPETPEALVHKHPTLGKTYWIKHEGFPHFDQVRIIHLRAEGFSFERVRHLDEKFEIYCTYVDLWHNLRKLAEIEKKETQF